MSSEQETNSDTEQDFGQDKDLDDKDLDDKDLDDKDLDTEQWIDWIALCRRSSPTQKLSDLLSLRSSSRATLSPAQLLDLACIDLIEQVRKSNPVSIESYLEQFPELSEPNALLDLVDAELCVRLETGELRDRPSELATYRKRFPNLASEIEELLSMRNEPPVSPSLEVSTPPSNQSDDVSQASDVSQSGDYSFDVLPPANSLEHPARASVPLASPPIDAPEWFLGEQCISSGDGHWLFRGRDSNTGETMAMKVIRLPSQTSSTAIERLLQACENASRVRSPTWIAPVVAASQNNYLAVIRPWIFGTHWQVASQIDEVPGRLRLFSKVAYALQSGHNSHAWHGALHGKNVIVDHQDGVHLVDAVGSVPGLSRWLGAIDHRTDRADRAGKSNWSVDANDLVKLILQDDIDVPGRWSNGLHDALRQLVTDHQHECFAQIGDDLIRRADAFVLEDPHSVPSTQPPKMRWRKQIARWIGGQ